MTYVAVPPDEPEALEAVLMGVEPVLVLGGELMLVEVLLRQLLSALA